MKAVNKKRTEKIILQKPNLVPDGAGGFKPATGKGKFIDVATVWAEFKTPKFTTQEVAGAVASVGIREVKIIFNDDVVKGWRILYGASVMTVDHVHSYGRSETVLVCKEVGK